jgi:hypothetical protein
MKKPPKVRETALDRLTAQLHMILRRETTDVIAIGKLLVKSRKHLPHGEWLPWLARNFDLSYRSAMNYCDAAEYADRKSKSATVADLRNVSPTLLYALAAGRYDVEEEAAILAATRKGRVDLTRATAIRDKLAPKELKIEIDLSDEIAEAAEALKAVEDAEIDAILDGPPPAVPPPAPNVTPDVALRTFDTAIGMLKQVMTKPPTRFADTIHADNDLQNVESFLRAVANERKTRILKGSSDA